ncbi:MAG: glycosyltransferase family 39 protein [Pseudomonadota bacterium]|nr:glycosyltransferase family 39 protein [Pseudomonadota bacterium]
MAFSSSSRVATVALLLLALALRLWGLDFGLPLAEARPDELTIAFQAMKFGRGDLNPHSFNYPSLFKYLMFALFGAYYAVGKVVGHFSGQEDFLRSFFDGAVPFRLLMRGWSAGMGTLGVALLLRAPGGRWGALLLAVAFLHVRDSHFGVTDITMVTLATAAVLACDALRKDGRIRTAVIAGVLAGLATSTKYNAALLCAPLTLAAILSPGSTVRLLAAAAAAMVGAFLVGTPFALLDPSTFVHDFRYELAHLAAGHHVDIGNAWMHHLSASLRWGLGAPLLAAGLFGIGVAFATDRREALVFYSFPILYFLAIGRGETAFFRYILPVVPFLCVAAGAVVARVARERGPAAGGVLLLALAAPTALSTVRALNLLAAGDTRDAMGTWIEANVPSGATLVHAGAYTGAPMLQRNVLNQTREYEAKQGRADSAGFRKPDELKWYRQDRPMYDVLFVEKEGIDFASQRSVASLEADPPPWLLVEEYFLVHYSAVPEAVQALAQARYERVHTESATDGPTADPVFDQQDAFYLPVAHFSGFTRMGPTLHLYRLRPAAPQ